MTVSSCAALVERGDPDRFVAIMAAPRAARPRLWPLYAFNLEIARAPWVTKEPMIAEMRLQWWRDVVAGPAPRAHEVAGPLHALIQSAALPIPVLDRMIEARRWDVYTTPFADRAAFDQYLDDTAAGLLWLAACSLGAGAEAEMPVRAYGWAMGLANYLRAIPELEQRGRRPLVDGRPSAIAALAEDGLRCIATARRAGAMVGAGAAALLAGWQSEAVLKIAMADPAAVAEGRLHLSEFSRRGRLMAQALTGRW